MSSNLNRTASSTSSNRHDGEMNMMIIDSRQQLWICSPIVGDDTALVYIVIGLYVVQFFFCFCLALHVNFHVGMRIGINRLNSAIYFCFFNQNDYKLHSRHDVASTACLIIAHKYIPRIREYNKMPGYWWFQTRSIQHSYYYYYYAKYNALTQAD